MRVGHGTTWWGVTGAALLVNGCIPVALNNSEGAGSVLALAWLPGAHLYIQVLGNERTKRLRAGPSHLYPTLNRFFFECDVFKTRRTQPFKNRVSI